MYNVQFIYVSIICRMLDAYTEKSHLDVTCVSQSLYSGPLSNPDFFLSLIAGLNRQVVATKIWGVAYEDDRSADYRPSEGRPSLQSADSLQMVAGIVDKKVIGRLSADSKPMITLQSAEFEWLIFHKKSAGRRSADAKPMSKPSKLSADEKQYNA